MSLSTAAGRNRGRRHQPRQSATIWRRLAGHYPNLVFQGNVDEAILRQGTPDQVREATKKCLAAGGGSRHIVNLNHGVDRTTPVANMQAFINTVRQS